MTWTCTVIPLFVPLIIPLIYVHLLHTWHYLTVVRCNPLPGTLRLFVSTWRSDRCMTWSRANQLSTAAPLDSHHDGSLMAQEMQIILDGEQHLVVQDLFELASWDWSHRAHFCRKRHKPESTNHWSVQTARPEIQTFLLLKASSVWLQDRAESKLTFVRERYFGDRRWLWEWVR